MDAVPQQLVTSEFEQLEELGEIDRPEPPAPHDARSLLPLHDVPVRVQALLGRAQLTIDQLLGLSVGSIIELDRRAGEPVDLLVNGRIIARGELVLIDGQLGVTLTELITAER